MAKKLKNRITISKEQLLKMEKKATRQFLIDEGKYNVHKPKVHKDKSKYTRKPRNKKQNGSEE